MRSSRALFLSILSTNNDYFAHHFTSAQEIDFKDLPKMTLASIPAEPTFSAHWLAIEGVQPDILQNPGGKCSHVGLLIKRKCVSLDVCLSFNAAPATTAEGQADKKDKKKKLFNQVRSSFVELLVWLIIYLSIL